MLLATGNQALFTDNASFVGYNFSGPVTITVSNNAITSGYLGNANQEGHGMLNGAISAVGSSSRGGSNAPNETTTYQRNAGDRVTSVTDPNGNTTSYTYDKNGNVTSVTDGNGNTTYYTYNAFNNVTSVTNPLRQTTTYGYNALGQMTSETDPEGDDPTYTYNAQGQVLTETDNDGGVTSYTYDLAGNETSITDPDGNVTSYSYNADNQVVSTTNPNGSQTTNVYNAAGLLTSTTDADGRTIDYGYNADGEETSQTWVGGNYTAAYGYNADGELISASDPYSSYSYAYNALGQETSVSNAGTPGVPTVTLSYTYDSYGNETSLSDSLGGQISYGYNADNEMTSLGLSVSGSQDANLTFSYDADGNVTSTTRTAPSVSGDTITSSYSYDKADELTTITDTDATKNQLLASYSYGYNANGDVTSYQDNSGNSLTYSYDADNQLLSASGTLAGSSYSVGYNYDANGNRTSTSTDVGGSVTSATYMTGTGNELLSDGTYDYTYDNDGNMLTQTDIATGNVTYYTWDYENRLTEEKVENSQGQVLEDEKFTYDVFGNRIGVSLNGTQQLYTVYDGSNPYLDFNGSGQLTERYLTNPNALSQFYAQVSASNTTEWFLTDNLNSIRQVVNSTGTSLDTITYDPYGNIVSQTNAANTPRFLYTGTAYDPITGTYLDGAREDDPENGRWLNQDPLGFIAGDSNLYRYSLNSPLNMTDPTGLMPNQAGAISLDQLIAIVQQYEQEHQGESPQKILSGLRTYFKHGGGGWVYVYSPKLGWIDIPHFLETATLTYRGVPGSVVELGGVLVEYGQLLNGLWAWGGGTGSSGDHPASSGSDASYHSAFTMEDLPSNHLGIVFGRSWDGTNLANTLKQFLSSQGCGNVPLTNPVYTTLPANEYDWHERDTFFGPIVRAIDYTNNKMPIHMYYIGKDMIADTNDWVNGYLPVNVRVQLVISRFFW